MRRWADNNMFRILFPVVLIAAAIGIFYFFTDPTYQEIKELSLEQESYNDALDNSKKLQAVRDQLLAKYNSFPATSIDRLEKMVPNNVDNVRLVLEIDRMAAKYGMAIKNIKLDSDAGRNEERDLIGKSDKPYGTVSLEFLIDGPYQNFISFISDLEKSLRIVDIVGVSFFSRDDSLVSQFNVKIKTYWLK